MYGGDATRFSRSLTFYEILEPHSSKSCAPIRVTHETTDMRASLGKNIMKSCDQRSVGKGRSLKFQPWGETMDSKRSVSSIRRTFDIFMFCEISCSNLEGDVCCNFIDTFLKGLAYRWVR